MSKNKFFRSVESFVEQITQDVEEYREIRGSAVAEKFEAELLPFFDCLPDLDGISGYFEIMYLLNKTIETPPFKKLLNLLGECQDASLFLKIKNTAYGTKWVLTSSGPKRNISSGDVVITIGVGDKLFRLTPLLTYIKRWSDHPQRLEE